MDEKSRQRSDFTGESRSVETRLPKLVHRVTKSKPHRDNNYRTSTCNDRTLRNSDFINVEQRVIDDYWYRSFDETRWREFFDGKCNSMKIYLFSLEKLLETWHSNLITVINFHDTIADVQGKNTTRNFGVDNEKRQEILSRLIEEIFLKK